MMFPDGIFGVSGVHPLSGLKDAEVDEWQSLGTCGRGETLEARTTRMHNRKRPPVVNWRALGKNRCFAPPVSQVARRRDQIDNAILHQIAPVSKAS